MYGLKFDSIENEKGMLISSRDKGPPTIVLPSSMAEKRILM